MFQHQVVSMSRRGLGVVCVAYPGAETALVSSHIVRSCVGPNPGAVPLTSKPHNKYPLYRNIYIRVSLYCLFHVKCLLCRLVIHSSLIDWYYYKVFQLCIVLAPQKIPCRYGRLIERLLLKVIAKQSLVLPMYLRHFKTLLC